MIRLFSGVLVAAVFAASACGSDEPTTSVTTYEQYFSSFEIDFDAAKDRAELAAWSTLVVEAVLIDVVDGPVFGSSASDPTASRFALFVFEAKAIVDLIHVQLLRPIYLDIDAIRGAMPLGARAVLYLIPVPPIPNIEKDLWHGFDPSVQQWNVTTSQGFILEIQDESGAKLVDLPMVGSAGLSDAPIEGSDVSAWMPPGGAVVPSELAAASG